MRSTSLLLLGALAALGAATRAQAGCGCAKPPPPRAAVRPFVGFPDQTVTLFDNRLVTGQQYQVQFVARTDGSSDWSDGRAVYRRDLADGALRTQLRVQVPKISLGPATINVWSNGRLLYVLPDDQFTVAPRPISLHDFAETVVRDDYQAAVGKDGTVYIPVDVTQVSDATTFTGTGTGFPLTFGTEDVVMYNGQGFLMQLLDPKAPGLFNITAGRGPTSDTLAYWRHEFNTYKQQHRQHDTWRLDDDPGWHADGTRHVDHNTIIVAISGRLADGSRPAPGVTAPFRLQVTSTNSPASPL